MQPVQPEPQVLEWEGSRGVGQAERQIKAVLVHGHTVSTGDTTANRRERTEGGRPGRHGSEFETKYIVTLYSHRGSTQNLDGLAAQYLGLIRNGSMIVGTMILPSW